MDDHGNNYSYDPSFSAAVIFAILYTICCATTTFQYFWYQCWFWIFIIIASWMEAIGYIARSVSVKDVHNRAAFIVQFLTIFLAPALMAASCYMAMGRVVLNVTPKAYCNATSLWVTPRYMTPVFVACDVISFLIQVVGGVSSVSNGSAKKRGYTIMKIGLAVQLLAFGFFIVISFRFHVFSKKFRDSWPNTTWVQFLWAINIGCCLIFVRSVYRFVEFQQGFDGYLVNHEWNFYVFEAAIILPVLLIYNFYHPAKYLMNISWKQDKRRKDLVHTSLRSEEAELM
ncbi:RTA1 like protein-domain-containing protein [Leptodontidium sp. 2 PMI_412]|nr:RTA1 like protein-domain-containing protein [Leptodontidium sp. MPI-SDFR-AT-0119]KAH9205306.1 RTA1 like protein-domain-containing protein [Leptodontidium sp. 2 PMI_412]